jgi:hypothetical protein
MSKTKNKPGIHLHSDVRMDSDKHWYKMWQWYIVSKNGNIVGKSWRWYKRKSGAVKSIRVTANCMGYRGGLFYYDHSKPDSPLKSYL